MQQRLKGSHQKASHTPATHQPDLYSNQALCALRFATPQNSPLVSPGPWPPTQQHEGPHVQVHEGVDEIAISRANTAANDVCGQQCECSCELLGVGWYTIVCSVGHYCAAALRKLRQRWGTQRPAVDKL